MAQHIVGADALGHHSLSVADASYDAGVGRPVHAGGPVLQVAPEPQAAGAPKILHVGDGPTDYSTIQQAIGASKNGDIIEISSGTYVEQVSVSGKANLTIRGAEGANVVIKAPESGLHSTGTDTNGRDVDAVFTAINSSNIVLQNVTVDGAGEGDQVAGNNNFVGVFYRETSGETDDVTITGVRDSSGPDGGLNGNQRGVGVLVANDVSGDRLAFTMNGGTIEDFQKNGTVIRHADLDVSGVTINGAGATETIAQNGFQAGDSTGVFHDNTVTAIGYAAQPGDGSYSGGFLLLDNPGLDIIDNTIIGANVSDAHARVVGIETYDAGTGSNAYGGEVTGNDISYTDVAIGAYDNPTNPGLLIHDNDVSNGDHSDDNFYTGVDFEPADTSTTKRFLVQGSADNDYLAGGAGNDTLDGGSGVGTDGADGGAGSGADYLSGGAGNDTYIVASTNSYAIEGDPDDGSDDPGGVDTVQASVSYSLANSTVNVENLTLTGSAGLTGVGDSGANTITGNGAVNYLYGAQGDDVLVGGGGRDHLFAGVGADTLTTLGDGDYLSGGVGSDTFAFTDLQNLQSGQINGFENGETIDLSDLDVQQVSRFTHTAGDFRVTYSAANDRTTVAFDMDGDGKADHKILINDGDFSHDGDIHFVTAAPIEFAV